MLRPAGQRRSWKQVANVRVRGHINRSCTQLFIGKACVSLSEYRFAQMYRFRIRKLDMQIKTLVLHAIGSVPDESDNNTSADPPPPDARRPSNVEAESNTSIVHRRNFMSELVSMRNASSGSHLDAAPLTWWTYVIQGSIGMGSVQWMAVIILVLLRFFFRRSSSR